MNACRGADRRGHPSAEHTLDDRRVRGCCCATPTSRCCSPAARIVAETTSPTSSTPCTTSILPGTSRASTSEVPALRRIVFETDAIVEDGRGVSDEMLAARAAAVRPSDRLVIVHTSGSTSEPKGVIHQHGPLLRHVELLDEFTHCRPDDVLFSNSPFFWIGGYAYSYLANAGRRRYAWRARTPRTRRRRSICSNGRAR